MMASRYHFFCRKSTEFFLIQTSKISILYVAMKVLGIRKKEKNQSVWQMVAAYALLIVVAASVFGYLQLDLTFADPDSFYHAKMALLLRDGGVTTEFPWLSATTLRYAYVDHHLLYHLLLIPFVTFFDPLIGLKIATVVLAVAAVVGFYWLLRTLRVSGALFYALLLLTTNPFIFRINLAKAQALVLLALFIIVYLLLNKRYLSLVVASALYVWLYAGWPLLLVLVLGFVGTNVVVSRIKNGWQPDRAASQQSWWLLGSVGIGLGAGVFFSPFFPLNVSFYWQQSFKIAVINYQNIIAVGGEWYPYQLSELLLSAIPLLVVVVFGLIVFVSTVKKQPVGSWALLFFSVIFFALTLKSRRNVEYLVPFSLAFAALAISRGGLETWLQQRRRPALIVVSISLLFFAAFSPLIYRDVTSVRQQYAAGFSLSRMAEPAAWLRQHVAPKEIIFHSDWDEFPFLFYYNDQHYYLVGLDPTFMYENSRSLFLEWADITAGNTTTGLAEKITALFNAQYVLVDYHQNALFDRNLRADSSFERVFENSEVRIYRVL